MVRDQSLEVKKRMMFIKEEDYNYLTYNIFLILSFLRCYSPSNAFKDYRKLSYLIPLISNKKYITSLTKRINSPDIEYPYEKQLLNELYYDSKLKHRIIASLLLALERKKYICMRKNKDTMDIWVDTEIASRFSANTEIFSEELYNCRVLKKFFSHLRTNANKTLEKSIFDRNGDDLWDI